MLVPTLCALLGLFIGILLAEKKKHDQLKEEHKQLKQEYQEVVDDVNLLDSEHGSEFKQLLEENNLEHLTESNNE